MAGALSCGPTALLSHRTAAALHALIGWRSSWPVDVSVVRGGGRARPTLAIHRPRRLHPDDRTEVAGIPVTSVARTLLDLASTGDRKQLERAFEEADRHRTLELAFLTQLIDRTRGHRGLKALQTVMREHIWPDPHTRTELEHAFARFCAERGIPLPHFNAQIGPYTADAVWPQNKLIAELDSLAGHGWLAAVERDRVRDGDLQLWGYRVVRISWRRLHDEPRAVEQLIRSLLQQPAEPPPPGG